MRLVNGPVSDAILKGDSIEYYGLENGLTKCSVRTDGTGYRLLQDEIMVMDGDWVVQGHQTLQGKNILLKGNLLIEEGASLTLESVRLVFDTGKDTGTLSERRLEVKNGAFVMKNSILRSTRQGNGINFYAEIRKQIYQRNFLTRDKVIGYGSTEKTTEQNPTFLF